MQTQKQQQSGANMTMTFDIDFAKIFADIETIFKGIPNCTPKQFLDGVVSHYTAQGLNVFICHPIHKCDYFEAKHHYEFKTNIISSKGFDIYLAHHGKAMVATNFGDGGESNWTFGGKFTKDHQTIKFE